jgi:hypothetical protein
VKEALKQGGFAQGSIDQEVEVKIWSAYARKRLRALHLE